jgi:hypothetical protein
VILRKGPCRRAHHDNAADEDANGTGGVGGEEDQSPHSPVSQSPHMHNGAVVSRHSAASAGSLPGSAARGNGRQDVSPAPALCRAALPAAAADASDSDWSPSGNGFHDEDLLMAEDGEDANLNVEAVAQAERRRRQG